MKLTLSALPSLISVFWMLFVLPVHAASHAPKAGLWIAVDEAYTDFINKGMIVPVEELLIIRPDGSAENRLMFFHEPFLQSCIESRLHCSDAPRTRIGETVFDNERLEFTNVTNPKDTQFFNPADVLAIGLTVMAFSNEWTVAIDEQSGLMRLSSGSVTRLFAPVEYGDLAALREAFRYSDLSASRHWRCFMAAAVHDNPAFETFGMPRRPAPDWFQTYLNAVSAMRPLQIAMAWPTSDDPVFGDIDLETIPFEWFFLPESEIGAMPKNKAQKRAVAAQMIRIQMLQSGKSAAEALELARSMDPDTPELPLIDDDGIAVLKRVSTGLSERGRDAEVDDLFCNDGRIYPDKPRPELNPFTGALSEQSVGRPN